MKIKITAIIILIVIAFGFTKVINSDNSGSATASLGAPGVIESNFLDGSLTEKIKTEDCTLTNGEKATCYRITITGQPVDTTIGPFCPTTTSSSAEDSGIWLDGTNVYDADGQFILDLSEIYEDAEWKLYDDNGNVNVTDTEEGFLGAAKPDVEEAYKYHCVEGKFEWTTTGKPVPISVLIPVDPVSDSSVNTTQGKDLGVTLNGVVIAASAPVDAILGAYTIAAFDDCGGHFNPFEGYHMHAFTNCEGASYGSQIDNPNAETKIIGYALDGVAVFAPLDHDSTIELDECNGRTTKKDGYHYYAQSPETNRIVKCFKGLTAIDESADNQLGQPEQPIGMLPPPGSSVFIYGIAGISFLIAIAGIFIYRARKQNLSN